MVGDREVRVNNFTPDADAIISAENQFNDPPIPGMQYVLVEVAGTYMGEDSSSLWWDMMYDYVGSKGNTFGEAIVVAPDDLADKGEAFWGATVSGNLVFEVASNQVQGGVLLMEEFSFDSGETKAFFALK